MRILKKSISSIQWAFLDLMEALLPMPHGHYPENLFRDCLLRETHSQLISQQSIRPHKTFLIYKVYVGSRKNDM